MATSSPTILPLASPNASLDQVGGKARALAQLARAGLPVPAGFVVSTAAYQAFVSANNLESTIVEVAADGNAEAAAAILQPRFNRAFVPPALARDITRAYETLGGHPQVAVRSSATGEDLPETSFAGLFDTSLNVCGADSLLHAVQRCWSSLWSAHAITYRQQMRVDQTRTAMAVIVQVMLDADVAGVLFTTNPTTGEHEEMVVNASWALGEAIVSGAVTPDTFVLDRATLQPTSRTLGSKQQKIVARDTGGTETRPVTPAHQRAPSLTNDQLSELGRLALTAERVRDDIPQDIEWAFAAGQCWLLQSRPITHLPPVVRWETPPGVAKVIRRQVAENMPEPLSPLFAELYLESLDQLLDSLVARFDVPIDVNDFVQRPFFLTVNGYAYCRADYRVSWRMLKTVARVLIWYVKALGPMLRDIVPHWRDEALPAYLEIINHWKAVNVDTVPGERLLEGIRALTEADAAYWYDVSMTVGAAKITDALLNAFLTSRLVKRQLTSGMFLRGFPSSTRHAQEELEAMARRLGAREPLRELVATRTADELTEAPAVRGELAAYLERYGHQIYNLDFVQPTLAEDPRPVVLSLKALLDNPDRNAAERARMIAERDALESRTLQTLGPVRRRVFRTLLRWAQMYGPYREEALFYMGAAWPTLRHLALTLGARLAGSGVIDTPDDVFYLQSAEIKSAIAGADCCYHSVVAERRALREARKRHHPPGIVPVRSRLKIGPLDLSVFETQKRNAPDSRVLSGFAVSPGRATGFASVIHSPDDFPALMPNSILVCPTTTPAWTPLFAQAAGLVTDVGGILAHGSIVAREYGIPAVMGTGDATQRIANGQRITVDGSTGEVSLLD